MIQLTEKKLRTVWRLMEQDTWQVMEIDGHPFCEPLATIHRVFWEQMPEALHGGFYRFNKESLVKWSLGGKVNRIVAEYHWEVLLQNYNRLSPSQVVSLLNDILRLVQTHDVKAGKNVEKNLSTFRNEVLKIYELYEIP